MNARLLQRYARWFNLPTGVLIALLQRSPVLRVVVTLGDYVLASPASNLLKGTFAAAASLGAVNSLAGATTLTSTSASPLAATVGASVSVAFNVNGTQTPPLSWTVSGTMPPGLECATAASGGASVTSGTINVSGQGDLYLRGTPTTAGNYTINLRAWEGSNATLTQSPLYSYVVNVTGGTVTAPTITTDPSAQTVAVGASVTFSVVASGSSLTYQWQKDGTNVAGATSASYTITNVQVSHAGNYAAVVTNSAGSVTSRSAMLTVTTTGTAPTITTQPVAQTSPAGSNVTFTVAASGSNLTYQWQKNGTNISGATSATLNLDNIQSSNGGDYTAVVTNAGGSVTSFPATLVVESPVQGRLNNLSVLTRAGSGSAALIAGFIISGNGNKTVLIRGTGQTLGKAPFNLSGVLSDPTLTLTPSGGAALATNDSWQSASNLNAITATGLTTLAGATMDAKDSIIMMALPVNGASGYTAQLADAGGGSGTGLVEVFDTDTTAPGAAGFDSQPRLSNLSARASVANGSNLIAGFIMNGTAPKRIMIRATGPTLAAYGVSGVLPDPKLTLQRTSDGKVFGTNDNWQSAANVAEIMAAGGNLLGTVQLDAKDAVLIVTLSPGSSAGAVGYTASVTDASGGSGVALIEVYDLQ